MFKVIIADDEPLIQEGIAEGIEWGRLECAPPALAENGLEAVGILRENGADIVITDVKMPGMNGIELARWIHENQQRVGVIILSGYDDFHFAQSAVHYGVTEYILKPTKLEEVESAVRKAIQKIRKNYEAERASDMARELMEYNAELEAVGRLIFNRMNGPDVLPKGAVSPKFQRVAVVQLCDSLPDFMDAAGYWTGFVKSIDGLTREKARKGIGTVTQSGEGETVICFYGRAPLLTEKAFTVQTDLFFNELRQNIQDLAPFHVAMEISGTGRSVGNLHSLYWEAAEKCDGERRRFGGHGPTESDLYSLVGGDADRLILQKDYPKACEILESLSLRTSSKPLSYVKSCAIYFVSHVVSVLGNAPGDSAELQKIYERIINTADRAALCPVMKDSIRKIFLRPEFSTSGGGKGSELTDQVIHYIRQSFFNDLTVENVAERFYISAGYLSRLLKKHCNATFLGILTKIRIENAKYLLRTSDYKAYEVGDMVGFKNPKYFSQVFKKITGRSPSEYKG